MLHWFASLVVTCSEILAPTPVLTPAHRPPPVQTPWIQRCNGLSRPCVLATAVPVRSGSTRGWVKIYLSRFDDGLKVHLETPPLGVPVVSALFDGDRNETLYAEDCDANRCSVNEKLDFKAARELHEAETLTLVLTLEPTETVKVSVDLGGLAAGLDDLPDDL